MDDDQLKLLLDDYHRVVMERLNDAGRPGPIGGVGPVSSRSAPAARQSSAFTLR
jgi:hypothetical protein